MIDFSIFSSGFIGQSLNNKYRYGVTTKMKKYWVKYNKKGNEICSFSQLSSNQYSIQYNKFNRLFYSINVYKSNKK